MAQAPAPAVLFYLDKCNKYLPRFLYLCFCSFGSCLCYFCFFLRSLLFFSGDVHVVGANVVIVVLEVVAYVVNVRTLGVALALVVALVVDALTLVSCKMFVFVE